MIAQNTVYTRLIFVLSLLGSLLFPRFSSESNICIGISAGILALFCVLETNKELKDKRYRLWSIILMTLFVTFLSPSIVNLGTQYVNNYIHKQFEIENAEFASNSHGFKILKEYAKKNYNLDIVLSNILPPHGVPSLIKIKEGYCELDIDPSKIIKRDKPGRKYRDVWIQGVMMHELGHCLDISKDYPTFKNSRIGITSLAPSDRKGVNSIETLLSAGKKRSTRLWREALADTFAVGYWRIRYPKEASSLEKFLINKRKDGDKAHRTDCWIKQAAKENAPVSGKELFTWALKIRNTEKCFTNY